MADNMIQLPSMIDPDARHIEFRAYECAQCGAVGPIAQASNPEWMRWGDKHHDDTGHTEVYQWTLTRNRGQISTLGALRPKRRALGQR